VGVTRRKKYKFIPILRETWRMLLKIKHEGETWDHLIRRLMAETGRYEFPELPIITEETEKHGAEMEA